MRAGRASGAKPSTAGKALKGAATDVGGEKPKGKTAKEAPADPGESVDLTAEDADAPGAAGAPTGSVAARSGGGDGGGREKKKAAPKAAAAPAAAGLPAFSEEERVQYRRALLDWYDHNHRVLPWRRTPHSKKAADAGSEAVDSGGGGDDGSVGPAPADLPQQQFAYWVWVSEVMLQQTQVATVIPYFRRWVAKWPTVGDLAAADIDTVNALWAGLGYYRRAKYLLEGARFVVDKLGGHFPTTAGELLKIPGVGPYTSAAVASIAFGSAAAAVDGNVVRVVSRLRALAGDPTKLAAAHAALAAELLDPERPGCYNQALMELGATVCRPVNPDCAACPARSVCRATQQWEAYLAAGGAPDVEDAPRVTQYPGRKAVKEKRQQAVAVTVLEVICAKQQQQQHQHQQEGGAAGAGAGAAGGTTPGGGGGAPAGAAPPRKRQRTMQDFALAAAARKQQQQQQQHKEQMEQETQQQGQQGQEQQGQGAAGGAGGGGAVDLEALVARGARHYLLVMRPQGGLLAGLWEFPGVVVQDLVPGTEEQNDDSDEEDGHEDAPKAEAEGVAKVSATSAAGRQKASDALLRRLLGPEMALAPPGPLAAEAAEPPPPSVHALQVLGRHEMGTYVHVFSHIRQTNFVQRVTAVFHGDIATLERLTRATPAAASAAAPAADGSAAEGDKEARRFAGSKAHGHDAAGGGGAATGADTDGRTGVKDDLKEPGPDARDGSDDGGGEEEGIVAMEEGIVAMEEEKQQLQQPEGKGKEDKEGSAKQRGGKGKAGAGGDGAGAGKRAVAGSSSQAASPGPNLDLAGEGAQQQQQQVMWVSRHHIEGSGLGLSSGVRKIFQLAVGGGAEGAASGRGGKGAAGAGKAGGKGAPVAGRSTPGGAGPAAAGKAGGATGRRKK